MFRRLTAAIAVLLLIGASVTALPASDQETISIQADESPGAEECALASPVDHTLEPAGVTINVTVHRPVLEDGQTAPLILHSHGWSGSRAQEADGLVGKLVDACYGVLSIDMRGHGTSGGQAHVHSPDHEIQDVIGILDWAHDELDWVTQEPGSGVEKDIVAGAIGGSYGGGYQLLTAALDDRLDALAPEITWNDLPYALAPNGAVKSDWVDLLYAGGVSSAELAPFIHQGYAWANAFNEFPDGTEPGEPDVHGKFVASSPGSYEDAITVPTLLIQGVPDGLFNLNQALMNYHQIREASPDGTEVNLVTHLEGHILSTDGTIPDGPPFDFGLQPGARDGACGDLDALVVHWYDEHLKGIGDDGAQPVELALDDGTTCLTDATTRELVLGNATGRTIDGIEGPIAVTQGAPVPSGYLEVDQVEANAASPVQVELFEVTDETAITGVPHLSGTATVAGGDAIAYLSIVVDDGSTERVVNSQVTPMRLAGPAQDAAFNVDLAGIGAALDPGDTVSLQISSFDTQYAHNGERLPGALVLEDLTLKLPVQ